MMTTRHTRGLRIVCVRLSVAIVDAPTLGGECCASPLHGALQQNASARHTNKTSNTTFAQAHKLERIRQFSNDKNSILEIIVCRVSLRKSV